MKQKNGLFKIADIVIIATICLIAVMLLFCDNTSKSEPIAVITVNGEEVRRIDLKNTADTTITLETAPTVTLEIKNCEIRFINAKCPDGTCEKSGYLSKAGDTAACVPAKTVITIESEDGSSDLDAVAG